MAVAKTLAEHTAEHLREVGEPAIMWGDVTLTHQILDRAGRRHRGPRSNRLLLNALEGSPLFTKKLVTNPSGRWLRSFWLADQ
jgi:hypothetical protein